MKASKNRRSAQRSSGGSRIFTYILIGLIVVVIGYYVVLPVFTPQSPKGVIPQNPTKITLNPSTDISGTRASISGQHFQANQAVTVTFGSSQLNLNGTCVTDSTGAFSGCTFWVPNVSSGTYSVTVTDGTNSASANFKVPGYSPPLSTIVVTVTSVSLGLVIQLVTKKVVDLDAERKMKAEVNAFNKEKREATIANDKVKLDKLKKRELQVRQAQAKLSTARFKVTLITFVPLIAVYYLMATFLGGYGVIVAYTPLPLPVFAGTGLSPTVFQVSLFWWYFLSSFTFSTMLSKVLHTTT